MAKNRRRYTFIAFYIDILVESTSVVYLRPYKCSIQHSEVYKM